ncbi:unnamed protein product [Strongylus vulgaris]|uniref:Uncharacterized protein n=1 Tax=Strongylus vulgaris TaxID=40348 RepID=A0A3P7J7I3_STRVU|nr:unnamed protein product [Strongylus vulgaris]
MPCFGKGTSTTRYGECLLPTNANLHALLEAAGRINYHIVLQGTKSRKTYVRQLSNGTLIICVEKLPSRNVGGVGFVDSPVFHVVDLHEILSPPVCPSTPSSATEYYYYR